MRNRDLAKFIGGTTLLYLAAAAVTAQLWGCSPKGWNWDAVEPVARSGGMVCLAVPDEDREVCAHAARIIQAAITAEQEYQREREAALRAADVVPPPAEPTAAPSTVPAPPPPEPTPAPPPSASAAPKAIE